MPAKAMGLLVSFGVLACCAFAPDAEAEADKGAGAGAGARAVADVRIIDRSEWNAMEAQTDALAALSLPLQRVVVIHSAGAACSDEDACVQQVRNIQNFHMHFQNFDDIGYNFLIGNDGHVYEGRGWHRRGAFARGYNDGSLGVVFIGNYDGELPTDKAVAAFHSFVAMGVAAGKLANDYKLLGHRQLSATTSPGNALYAAIKEWPHWSRRA